MEDRREKPYIPVLRVKYIYVKAYNTVSGGVY